MDSDKRAKNSPINETKKRIVAEFGKSLVEIALRLGGRAGVENQIPHAALENISHLAEELSEYELLPEFERAVHEKKTVC